MKCSKMATCPHSCLAKNAVHLSIWLEHGIARSLKNNNVPQELADKVGAIIDAELDACEVCDVILNQQSNQSLQEIKPIKGRVFDRAIVHMFELFYASVIERSRNPAKLIKSAPEFFNIVPRGECLDLFLKMIKRQCIGNDEVAVYTAKLEMLLDKYSNDGDVDWDRVYISGEFSSYLFSLFTVIFSHMKSGEYPVPALNNGMADKHSPERINLVLKHMLTIWEVQQKELDITFEQSQSIDQKI